MYIRVIRQTSVVYFDCCSVSAMDLIHGIQPQCIAIKPFK